MTEKTTANFAFTCWYRNHGCFPKEKALLFDVSNGFATLLLESGRFITDRIDYVTLDDAEGVFAQCKWKDAEDDA